MVGQTRVRIPAAASRRLAVKYGPEQRLYTEGLGMGCDTVLTSKGRERSKQGHDTLPATNTNLIQ